MAPATTPQNIGDVNDIVLTKDGKAQSLVIGVGGFLGMGEKNVAYDFAKAAVGREERRSLAGGPDHQGGAAGAAGFRPQGL